MRCARGSSFSFPCRLSEARLTFSVDGVLGLLRRNGLFAVSEISKAFVVVGYGDFATADAVGELVAAVFPSATSLRSRLTGLFGEMKRSSIERRRLFGVQNPS